MNNNSASATVTPILPPPDAVDDIYTTPVNTTVNGNVLTNDVGGLIEVTKKYKTTTWYCSSAEWW
jgi:hypothetical protein